MEPNHNNFTPSSELPQPQEVDSEHANEEKQSASKPEKQLGPLQSVPVSLPFQPPADITAGIPASVPALNSQGMGAVTDTQHLIADDAELIEKEWVMKAKAIVAHTKDDPYKQNQEMTKVKSDYLKKRYNKELKGSEG